MTAASWSSGRTVSGCVRSRSSRAPREKPAETRGQAVTRRHYATPDTPRDLQFCDWTHFYEASRSYKDGLVLGAYSPVGGRDRRQGLGDFAPDLSLTSGDCPFRRFAIGGATSRPPARQDRCRSVGGSRPPRNHVTPRPPRRRRRRPEPSRSSRSRTGVSHGRGAPPALGPAGAAAVTSVRTSFSLKRPRVGR